MLPPPITIPISAPMSTASLISLAYRSMTRNRTRIPSVPASASPESLSEHPRVLERRQGAAPVASGHAVTSAPQRPRPSGTGEAAYDDALANLGRELRDEVADRRSCHREPSADAAARFLVERLDLAASTILSSEMRGLPALPHLLLEQPPLALDPLGRHIILVDRRRRGRRRCARPGAARACWNSGLRATKSVSQLTSTSTRELAVVVQM